MTGILTFIFTAFALLPLRVLYWFADLAYLVLYHIVRYRRTTVSDNLRQCFPDKTPEELRRIEKQFYRNFADYVVETVKLLHISDREMMRRMEFRNIGLMDRLMAEASWVMQSTGEKGSQFFGLQSLQDKYLAAGQQCTIDLKGWIFCGGTD